MELEINDKSLEFLFCEQRDIEKIGNGDIFEVYDRLTNKYLFGSDFVIELSNLITEYDKKVEGNWIPHINITHWKQYIQEYDVGPYEMLYVFQNTLYKYAPLFIEKHEENLNKIKEIWNYLENIVTERFPNGYDDIERLNMTYPKMTIKINEIEVPIRLTYKAIMGLKFALGRNVFYFEREIDPKIIYQFDEEELNYEW